MTQIMLTVEDSFKDSFLKMLEIIGDKVKIEKQQTIQKDTDDIFDLVGKTEWDGDLLSQREQRGENVSY